MVASSSGFVAEDAGVEREVAVGGVRGDADVVGAGVKVDRLCSGDDDRLAVRGECHEGIEKDLAGGDVAGVGGRHVCLASSRDSSRHTFSFASIQSRSA